MRVALSIDGTVAVAGDAPDIGPSVGSVATGYALGICATPTGQGYWTVRNTGVVDAYGDAPNLGSLDPALLHDNVVSCASTASGNGYWLLDRTGRVFSFGDAQLLGDSRYHPNPNLNAGLNAWGSAHRPRLVRIIAVPSASGDPQGYWVQSDQGQIFAFGTATLVRDGAGATGTNNLALFTE